MKKIFSKNFATLLITIILIGISLGLTIFGKYSLGTKHYWGILLILISVILYFINRKAYVVVFVMTLILGLVGLINVFYNDFRIGI